MKPLGRSAISPIIATLLLIAIAVSAGIIVYVFVTGLAGTLTASGGSQVTEQLSMDANVYSPVASGVAVYVRNTGTATVTLDCNSGTGVCAGVFFDGLTVTDTHTGFSGTACQALATAYTIPVGTVCYFSITTTPTGNTAASQTSGTSHAIKVVTKTGGTFVFTVIAGRSG